MKKEKGKKERKKKRKGKEGRYREGKRTVTGNRECLGDSKN
jgi:hypothetical protein